MRSIRSIFLAVALFAIALYAVTLGGTFVYDDVAVVQQDRRLADPHDWGQYWTDSYNFGVDNLYRPLVSMTYAIEHYLHSETAWPYHAVNIVLHAIASVMVAWVAFRLLEGVCPQTPDGTEGTEGTVKRLRTNALQVALLSGLLFAVHPVHVEAVANIVGRAELMCALATLGAIGLAIGTLTAGRVVAIWLCCAIAILCKEQGLLAAVMVGVVRYCTPSLMGGVPARRDAVDGTEGTVEASRSDALQKSSHAPLLFALLMANIATIVFIRENLIHLKFWWDRKFLDPWIQPLSDSVGIDRWLAPFTIAGRYLGLLVMPTKLRIDYGGPIVPGVVEPRDPFFWLGIVAVLLWLAIVGIAWRRRDRMLLILALLFAIAYAPVSNWPTIIGVNVAERLMYLPSAFFVMLAAVLLSRIPRPIAISVTALFIMIFSIRTVTYAMQWNDRLAFYEYSVRIEPRSMKATLLAMEEQANRGDLDAAIVWAHRAIDIEPNYDDAWIRLAGVLMDKGDLEAAQAAIDKAKAIRMSMRVVQAERRMAELRVKAMTRQSPSG